MGILDELEAVKKAEALAGTTEALDAVKDAEKVAGDVLTSSKDAEELFAAVRRILAKWPALTGEAL